MKRAIVIIILFIFTRSNHANAGPSISCRILDLIMKDINDSGKEKTIESYHDITDSVGQITRIIDSTYKVNISNKAPKRKIILIDTFRFFETYNCQYEVKYFLSEKEIKSNSSKEYFIVTGIATGRKNALAIAISKKGTLKQMIYYVSINGNKVSIIDKYESAIGE
jgi:hypothetical protein